MDFPIEVKSIKSGPSPHYREGFGAKVGDFVSVRPCGEECHDKTFLGIYLGDFPCSLYVDFKKETGELTVDFSMMNPAIFVPDLNKVIRGYESWWGTIKYPEQLYQITDADIDNIWYVKALKILSAAKEAPCTT